MPNMISEDLKQVNSDIIRERKITHIYNARSRVNHVTKFKNTPKISKMDMTDIEKAHICSD